MNMKLCAIQKITPPRKLNFSEYLALGITVIAALAVVGLGVFIIIYTITTLAGYKI